MKIRNIFFLWCLLAGQLCLAQSTLVYTSEDVEFRTALELFDKKKFAAAQSMFQEANENQ